jgi:acetyl-CoA carboxylase biotin carboxyl carrier protein
MMGNVWRIGDKDRVLKVGDIVREGQEIMNLEAMKIETAVLAPMHGIVKEIPVTLNQAVMDKQLLMVLGDMPWSKNKGKAVPSREPKKPE